MKKILLLIAAILSLALPAFGQYTVPTYSAGYLGKPTSGTPTFSPGTGSYGSTQSVTISATGGSVICYNTTGSPATNGTTGCTTGTLYTGAVSVSTSETLYAVSGGTGYTDSSVGSATYTISAGPTIAAVGTPACASVGFSSSVTISPTISATGDQLFISVGVNNSYSPTVSSVTDNGGSGGSTYTHPAGFPQTPTLGTSSADEWYTLSLHSGVTVVTVHFGTNVVGEVCAQEYQNGVSIGATNKGEGGGQVYAPSSYSYSTTTSAASSFMIGAAGYQSPNTVTATSGTIRDAGSYAGSACALIQDNTGSTTNVVGAQITAAAGTYFDYVGIELKNH